MTSSIPGFPARVHPGPGHSFPLPSAPRLGLHTILKIPLTHRVLFSAGQPCAKNSLLIPYSMLIKRRARMCPRRICGEIASRQCQIYGWICPLRPCFAPRDFPVACGLHPKLERRLWIEGGRRKSREERCRCPAGTSLRVSAWHPIYTGENVCQPGQLRDAHAGGSPVGFIAKHPLGNLRPGVFRLVSSWATILLAPEERLCTEGPRSASSTGFRPRAIRPYFRQAGIASVATRSTMLRLNPEMRFASTSRYSSGIQKKMNSSMPISR